MLLPLAALTVVLLPGHDSLANSLGRDSEPVVLTGAQIPALLGAVPGEIVAFRFEEGCVQLPLQVDEVAEVDGGSWKLRSRAAVTGWRSSSGVCLRASTSCAPRTATGAPLRGWS
ncbi:MAG: hypothetical protein GF400_00540 [Candidatus Eisenbacteria bacterium]|nr:hypothetical protein [Candidatus Eisenbacteria bacterium]